MAPRFPPSPLPIAAHAGGNWSLLLHSQGRIAIQAGQGILTSIFFADKVSTHIHPWRTKEHDRTVCLQQTRGNFMKEGTEWPLSPYLSPSYIFRQRSGNSSIPPLGGRQQSISWEYRALLAASFLFARSYFLIWFYNQGNEAEGARFTWVRSGSSCTVNPQCVPSCHQLTPPLSQAAQIH